MNYNQNDLWNVKTLAEFNTASYDSLITSSCLDGSEQCIKLSKSDDDWCDGYVAHKKHKARSVKTTYFVPTSMAEKVPIKVLDKKKVRFQQKVYWLITSANSIKINPEQVISFRDLVDKSGLPTHTVPLHYTLYKIIILTARLGKMCARVVTESSFGKDKYIEMVRLLLNGTTVLTDPTIAKLHNRIQHDKFVVISEMPGTTSGDKFTQLCNAFMAIGDDRQILDNRARSARGTAESAFIGNKSVLFIHNPISYYNNVDKKGFEEIYPHNVLNRYIPFSFDGYTKTKFSKNINPVEYMKEHRIKLVEWIKTAKWYETNWHTIKNKYSELNIDNVQFKNKEERWKTNFNRLCTSISMYAKDSVEYIELVNVAHQCYMNQKNVKREKEWYEGEMR